MHLVLIVKPYEANCNFLIWTVQIQIDFIFTYLKICLVNAFFSVRQIQEAMTSSSEMTAPPLFVFNSKGPY